VRQKWPLKKALIQSAVRERLCCTDQSIGAGVWARTDDGNRALVLQEGQARYDWWSSLVLRVDSSSTQSILARSAPLVLPLSAVHRYAGQCNVLRPSGQQHCQWLHRRTLLSIIGAGLSICTSLWLITPFDTFFVIRKRTRWLLLHLSPQQRSVRSVPLAQSDKW